MSLAVVPYQHNQHIEVYTEPVIMMVDVFIHSIKKDGSPATFNTYNERIKTFRDYTSLYPVLEDKRQYLRGFKAYLRERFSSASTINLSLSVVRSYFKWLLEAGVIDKDPTSAIKNVSSGEGSRRTSLSKYQLSDLMEHISMAKTKMQIRNRVIVSLAIANGLRVAEMASINIEDISSRGENYVIYIKRKGYDFKDNYTILHPKVYSLIRTFVDDRSEGALFRSQRGENLNSNSLSRVIKSVMKEAGIDSPSITAHSLRSTYCELAIDAGVALIDISISMNHKSVQTTQGYIKNKNRDTRSAELRINLDIGELG